MMCDQNNPASSSLLTEMDRKVYREELQERLPEKIFDCHVHLWARDAFPADSKRDASDYMNYFACSFPVERWEALLRELLAGKEVWYNAFSMPDGAVKLAMAPRCRFNMSLVSPFDPVEVLEERMEKNCSIGVKPYWNFARKNAADTEIRDMMTPAQLAMLNRRKAIVTLHIPRPGRFEDPCNQRQMVELCETYPGIDFIFAHIGRAYFMRNIRKSNLEELAGYSNCFFDTAMLNHEGVFRYTLDHFPAERILFGSDAPIALLHGKSVEINNAYCYLCAENYRIGSMVYVPGMREKFTLFYYEQLRSLLEAIPQELQQQIFFQNAFTLFTGKERQ
ncbi:MAG: amidohydrolase family protein [Victivallaceae bacterium]|nr:amidohydrolase family protein [Victivallaceae bacterium]